LQLNFPVVLCHKVSSQFEPVPEFSRSSWLPANPPFGLIA
jgi:hypothetical protein